MKLITTNMYAYNYAVRLISDLLKEHYPDLELESFIKEDKPTTKFVGIGENIEIIMHTSYDSDYKEIVTCPYIETINKLKEILNNESIR